MHQIILASQSPRRKQLLALAQIPCIVKVADVEEVYPEALAPKEVPVYLAKLKAEATLKQLSTDEKRNAIIIASDTVVVANGKILGKPKDKAEAIQTLQSLSGQVHQVITGVHICGENMAEDLCEIVEVHFRNLTNEEIIHYVDQFQPYDKAGSYAIQEWIGAIGIEKINGDYYAVMGLPISKVYQTLKTHNINYTSLD